MKFLLDMNLSPEWCEILRQQGWECHHWVNIGDPRATDTTILAYAKDHSYVVFTHDLDFSAILAATKMQSPRVFQIRAQDLMSDRFRKLAVEALRGFQTELESGALIVIDEHRYRVRMLPLG